MASLYVVTVFGRLIALEPETGKELWAFDPKLDKTRSQMLFSSRGAAFWTDGKDKRLFYGTLDGQLWAINAATGQASRQLRNRRLRRLAPRA